MHLPTLPDLLTWVPVVLITVCRLRTHAEAGGVVIHIAEIHHHLQETGSVGPVQRMCADPTVPMPPGKLRVSEANGFNCMLGAWPLTCESLGLKMLTYCIHDPQISANVEQYRILKIRPQHFPTRLFGLVCISRIYVGMQRSVFVS